MEKKKKKGKERTVVGAKTLQLGAKFLLFSVLFRNSSIVIKFLST